MTPAVLNWAQFLGARFDARVTAVHVISSAILSHVLSVEAAASKDQIFDQARVSEEFAEQSDQWMESLLKTGLDRSRVSSLVLFGDAGQEIVAAAKRMEAELIIVGSRGAGSVARSVLGSVAAEVLRGAPCPVLVISETKVDLESTRVRSPAEETAGAPTFTSGIPPRSRGLSPTDRGLPRIHPEWDVAAVTMEGASPTSNGGWDPW